MIHKKAFKKMSLKPSTGTADVVLSLCTLDNHLGQLKATKLALKMHVHL